MGECSTDNARLSQGGGGTGGGKNLILICQWTKNAK
jgi:hypothetical protein